MTLETIVPPFDCTEEKPHENNYETDWDATSSFPDTLNWKETAPNEKTEVETIDREIEGETPNSSSLSRRDYLCCEFCGSVCEVCECFCNCLECLSFFSS
uniref:Uncharacterized protein n=1 Tax=Corethron hystrix TaxID=216773 RepID=A0A7S1FTG1_9STRA|mmetsp:Transcript_27447/g.63013  ORF Transcript_27447/g.63013 Transcript_27447/m.63013 type:complete len:100 (+) Transcript_27447:81-380(+)